MKLNNLKKTINRTLLHKVITPVVFILLGVYIWRNREIFLSLRKLNIGHIIIIMFFEIILSAVYALINKIMINRLDNSVSYMDSFYLQFSNNLLNKISPKGGAVFRAMYLKTNHDLSYANFLSSISGLYVLSFSSMAIIGLLCLLFFYLSSNLYNLILTMMFLSIMVGLLVVIIASPKIPETDSRVIQILKKIIYGWNIIKQDRKQVLFFIILTIISAFIISYQNLFIYRSLGAEVNLIQMLFLSSLSIINSFINFTPDGIGVKEGTLIFSSNVVSIPADVLVLGSLMMRVIGFFVSLLFGSVSYIILSRKIKRSDMY